MMKVNTKFSGYTHRLHGSNLILLHSNLPSFTPIVHTSYYTVRFFDIIDGGRCLLYTDEGIYIRFIVCAQMREHGSNLIVLQSNIPLIPKGNFYKSAYFKIIGEKHVLATKTEPIYSVWACQQNSTTRFVF